jgi:3-oxosteroid 1-dehydrogenase
MDNQSYETDILIIGSGGGGMTAALVAHDAGLRTLIVEKTPYYGGSTARSGGGIWVPNNYLMRQAGVDDSLDLARTYMQATIGNRTPRASQDAYLHNAGPMIEWLRDHTELKWRYMPGYPDYYPERPGGKAQGRAVEAELFDGNLLGADRAQLNPSPIEAGGMAFTASEYRRLGMVMRTWQGKLTAMRILLRLTWARLTGKKTLMMGRALIARLRLSLKKRDIPLWLNTPLHELILENGRVVGAQVERDGKPLSIYARKGVILAAGCFAHNLEMRLKYQKHPITTDWTTASPGNTGDAILAGMRVGAAVDLMDEAWWGPSTKPPGEPPFFHVGERGYPGLIMVNQKGQRFTNESASYVEVVQVMYQKHTDENRHIPCYFIFDQRYRNNYLFGRLFPRQPIPANLLRNGYIKKADSLEKLAGLLGMDPSVLVETVRRFNGFAKSGKDLDYGRGDSAYDNYYGDRTVKPNPNLAPLKQAPFYAVEVVPGDLGTRGGLVTDEFARVRREDGEIIEGLYCVGNNSASVMGTTYPGPGCTIGATMTFGYIAARHAAGISAH